MDLAEILYDPGVFLPFVCCSEECRIICLKRQGAIIWPDDLIAEEEQEEL